MAGTINSLGLGSGVLTSDLIDKLRTNDEGLILKPIDNKITLHQQKGQALDLLSSLLSSFKSSVSALDDDNLYQKRSVSGGNEYASVSAATGSQIRDFALNVTNIAKKSVLQSGTFSSSSASVASVAGKLNLGIGGTNYSIDYTAGMTLDNLKQAINDAAGKNVSASVLQTGTSAYSLVITSKNTGQNQAISLTDISGNLNTNLLTSNVKTGSFVAADAFVAATGTTGNVAVKVGNTSVNFAYTDTTTLKSLADNINADTTLNTKVTADIVQYGTNDYRMVLTPKAGNTGSVISLSDTATGLNSTITSTTNASQTGAFAANTTPIASTGSTGNVSVNIGTTTVNLAYTDTTTLQDLANNINADTTLNTKVTASIVNFGTNDYRMVLTQKDGTTSSAITLTDSAGGGLIPSITSTSTPAATGSMAIIQDPQDAHFTFDGISLTRSTNTVTDISSGLTVNLLKDNGSANISIVQNKDQITTEMESMVSSYNTLIKQLDDMTAYNAAEGKVGIFNGDNTIKNISREITKIITSFQSTGYSLPQYGISLDKTGTMSFDKSAFTAKMNADPDAMENFFSGKTKITSVGTTNTGSFSSASTLISSGASGTMSIKVGSVGYSFAYSNTTTLQQMADSINADSAIGTKLSASILQYGTNDYRMVLTPKNEAIGETIAITDSTGGGLLSAMTSTKTTENVLSYTNGVFTSLNDLFKGYTSSTGLINNLTQSSKTETASLNEERTKASKLLEARYATMQAKFAAYDSMISKLNSQFASLKQQIDAQANANK